MTVAPSRLVLVRHGESTYNAEGRLQGQADPPLSARGRAQARETADWASSLELDRVVCSDLERAVETAALLGFPDAGRDPAWREIHIGAWTGRLTAEVLEQDADAFRAWRAGARPAPEGESFAQLSDRIGAAGERLLGEGGTALVVTHGGAIRTLVTRTLSLGLGQLGGVGNTSHTILERTRRGVRLASYNASGAGSEEL